MIHAAWRLVARGVIWPFRRGRLCDQNVIVTGSEPTEIADMALFLASPEARHVTGQIIAVDGNLEWEP